MSECRSLTNFIGNAVATVVVARWDKALDQDRLAAALGGKPMPPVMGISPASRKIEKELDALDGLPQD